MPGIEANVLSVCSPDPARRKLAGLWRDQMVIAAINVKDGHGNLPEVDPAAPQFHFALDEQIILIAIFDELPKGLTRNVRAVEYPLLHADKILHECPIVHILKETYVLIYH